MAQQRKVPWRCDDKKSVIRTYGQALPHLGIALFPRCSMPHKRQDPLLKNEPARSSYGATSSSSGLEAGTGNAEPEETTGWFSPSTKQIIAGSALLLSGGMKIAELIVTSEWSCAFVSGSVRPITLLQKAITTMVISNLSAEWLLLVGFSRTSFNSIMFI